MRELLRSIFMIMLFVGIGACASNEDEIVVTEDSIELIQTVSGNDGLQTYFTIDLPSEMKKMDDLHESALVKYASLNEVELVEGEQVIVEHYVIVLMERKEEIRIKHADTDLDLTIYLNSVRQNFEENYHDKFKWLTPTPVIGEINGLSMIQGEAIIDFNESAINGNSAFYKIAVFEGETAFYQVITWCIDSQRNRFESKMDQVIASFKEAKSHEE